MIGSLIGNVLGQWTYLVTTLLISSAVIGGAEVFHKNTLRSEWRIFGIIIFTGLLQGIPMSHYSIVMDAYGFGEKYILGPRLTVAPVEDVMFAVAVPAFIAAVTIYYYNHV